MGLIGRWLSEAIRLALALGLAIAAMQVPAVATDYANALLQISADARRDIEGRKATVRRYYNVTVDDDAALLAALRQIEPANAESLGNSIRHAAALREAHARIAATSPLLRPLVALADGLGGEEGKTEILRTALENHVPGIALDLAGATYGLVGLLLGALLAQLLLAPFAARTKKLPAGAANA